MNLFIFVFLSIVYSVKCICLQNICCSDFCTTCGSCNGNLTIDNLCCNETIINSNRTCDIYDPPCWILNEEKPDQYGKENGKDSIYFDITDITNIITIIILGLISLCMIYACCCFDKRKPPAKYKHLIIATK